MHASISHAKKHIVKAGRRGREEKPAKKWIK